MKPGSPKKCQHKSFKNRMAAMQAINRKIQKGYSAMPVICNKCGKLKIETSRIKRDR